MKRSRFLLLSASGVVAIALPSINACRGSVEYPDSLSQPTSLSKIWDEQKVRSVGTNYRNTFPGEANKRTLVELLSTNGDGNGNSQVSLEEQIREDFKNSDTVNLDGWILSETEARQCALFSLEQKE